MLPRASGGDPAFISEHFSGSANCTMCHNGLNDQDGLDVSIETDWPSTMMANSTRDPFWRAKVRSELNRNPQLAGAINDKCSRCHAPMANFEAKNANEPLEILDNGFQNANNTRHDEALNGVSCTACHPIKNAGDPGTLPGFSGQFEIDSSKTIHGPYDKLSPNPMITNTGFTPTCSTHVKASKLCATCHNLKTPFVDESGTVLSTTPESEFPEQMPYTEWEHSSYAGTNPKSCQQCHMSRADGVSISTRPRNLEGRDDFAIHEFAGANKLMLDVFDKNTLNFPLKINSNTGHKLPSGFPSRRVILHVTVYIAHYSVKVAVSSSGFINPVYFRARSLIATANPIARVWHPETPFADGWQITRTAPGIIPP